MTVFAFLGTPEIIVILIVALLVFGPEKLPEIGKQVGTAMRELNKMRDDLHQALELNVFTDQAPYDDSAHTAQDDGYQSIDSDPPHYENPHEVEQGTFSTTDAGQNAMNSSCTGENAQGYGIDIEPGGGSREFVAPPGPKSAILLSSSSLTEWAEPTSAHSTYQETV